MYLLILMTADVELIAGITIWIVVVARVVKAAGVAAIQNENTSDPDVGAIDKRQIPDLNSQRVESRAGLDKIARVAMSWDDFRKVIESSEASRKDFADIMRERLAQA